MNGEKRKDKLGCMAAESWLTFSFLACFVRCLLQLLRGKGLFASSRLGGGSGGGPMATVGRTKADIEKKALESPGG